MCAKNLAELDASMQVGAKEPAVHAGALRNRPMAQQHNTNLPWYAGAQGGGTPGVTQFSLQELRSRCRKLLTSDTYLKKLEEALNNRTCPPAIEAMLYHYAYGKPAETLNVNASSQEDLTKLSTDELAERAAAVTDALRKAAELEAELAGGAGPTPSVHTPSITPTIQ